MLLVEKLLFEGPKSKVLQVILSQMFFLGFTTVSCAFPMCIQPMDQDYKDPKAGDRI